MQASPMWAASGGRCCKKVKKITVYADGACSGNPGPGGYGAILKYGQHEKELSGYDPDTTNNRMELTAVLSALAALQEPCEVTVYTDSRYICDAVNNRWVIKWRDNGWRRAQNASALNSDLWEKMLEFLAMHKVTFEWVKGHADNEFNNRCDQLAVAQYKAHMSKAKGVEPHTP